MDGLVIRIQKRKIIYGITLPLGNYDMGGPLFFEHYTFLGIDPNGLVDSLGNNYFEQGKNHTLINRAYCLDNPKKNTRVMELIAGGSLQAIVTKDM